MTAPVGETPAGCSGLIAGRPEASDPRRKGLRPRHCPEP